jgi:hypothetical protein
VDPRDGEKPPVDITVHLDWDRACILHVLTLWTAPTWLRDSSSGQQLATYHQKQTGVLLNQWNSGPPQTRELNRLQEWHLLLVYCSCTADFRLRICEFYICSYESLTPLMCRWYGICYMNVWRQIERIMSIWWMWLLLPFCHITADPWWFWELGSDLRTSLIRSCMVLNQIIVII